MIPLLSFAVIKVVSAENVYGKVAQQIGGKYVNVTNIINGPQQDPHLFSLTPSTAQTVLQAQVIIYNGSEYDAWLDPLLSSKVIHQAVLLNVSRLATDHSNDNPHYWYKPTIMLKFAQTITQLFSKLDPAHQASFAMGLRDFNNNYQKMIARLSALKAKYNGTAVIATEPIFNYLAEAAGLKVYGQSFQLSNMNEVPPTISTVKAFEDNLRQHRVKVLIYNSQILNPLTEQMINIARAENIPVLGVTEMAPINASYFDWIDAELDALEVALQQAHAQ